MKNFIFLLLLVPVIFSLQKRKKIVLSEEHSVKFSYSFPSQTRIRLFLSYKSDGYIGFGIGGGIHQGDMLTCNFKDDIPQIKDFFSADFGALTEDKIQDWTLISGSRKNGLTKFVVERELKTGDSLDKELLVNTPQPILWAFGRTDELEYHFDKRGIVYGVIFEK